MVITFFFMFEINPIGYIKIFSCEKLKASKRDTILERYVMKGNLHEKRLENFAKFIKT